MIFLHANLFVVPVGIVSPRLRQLEFEVGLDSFVQDGVAESGSPHDVVLGPVDRVGLFVKFHAYSLYGKLRDLAHIPAFTGGVFPLR